MSYSRLILANLLRNTLRPTLTAGAITLAVLLVCLLLTMPAALDRILEGAVSDVRISVHHKAGLVYSLPSSFVRKVRALDGVEAAVAMSWYGGAYEESGNVTFPNFTVEPEHIGAVYSDYPILPEHLADFLKYRDGALVGRQPMEKYGWEVGDRITLMSTIWPVDADLRIVAVIDDPQAPMVWFNREYLDQAMQAQFGERPGEVGIIWVRASDPTLVSPLMQTIDEMSRNSAAETASETEKSYFMSFFGSLQGFVRIILLVTALVTLCIIFIAANTASMNVRERSGEIAIMKAIGFARRSLFGALLGEAVFISSLAGLVGLGLAIGLTAFLRGLGTGGDDALGPMSGFVLTAPVVVEGVFLSLFIGMLAGVVPSFGAARRPVVESLREIF